MSASRCTLQKGLKTGILLVKKAFTLLSYLKMNQLGNRISPNTHLRISTNGLNASMNS